MGIVEAAVKGAREVSMAVIASTLTTVAVFFPLVFVQGVAGQLFRDQALTVTFAMLISLVVAMTLIPMLASLKGRSPIAYKEEEPSPGWQPSSKVGRGVKRVVTPVSKTFFRWIPYAITRRHCLRLQPNRQRHRQGVARDRPRRADAVQRRGARVSRVPAESAGAAVCRARIRRDRVRRQRRADSDAWASI